MGSCREGQEDRFFDTREDITSVSDSGSDSAEDFEVSSEVVNWVSRRFHDDVWINNPGSVQERRNKFLRWMGLSSDPSVADTEEISDDEVKVEIGRITETSEAVLRTSGLEDEFSSSRSSMSHWSGDGREFPDSMTEEGIFVCRFKNLDDGTEFVVDGLGQDGMLSRLREVKSNRLFTVEEFERTLGLSPLVQQFLQSEIEGTNNIEKATKRMKKGWLRRLGAAACVVDRQLESGNTNTDKLTLTVGTRVQRVRVRPHKKKFKELSALYIGQDIPAHEGSILTMKFSLDGQYLATAGEDGIVRVWQVMVDERLDEVDLPDIDSSCIYFTVNNLSELSPLYVRKEKMGKVKSMRKTSDSACIIFPPKIFRISDKPLHEFHGHSGEILDLSWSKNKHLLSSSVDKTVRLWQVGHDECLKVFLHNNYVTCVQFNPVDDNYFISGSIDGKVRIWAIPGCRVVDWTDIIEIVTAVCYRPDGQGGIIGSMTGNCRFYDASDNNLQLGAQIILQAKKKSSNNRITGFQFLPSDPGKLMVTSADAQVRILHGVDVIYKYRGLRNSGSQIHASFTSDGKHIVSAADDSNVYIWNYMNQEGAVPSAAKNMWSSERFFSNNASIAIPWCGMKSGNSAVPSRTAHAETAEKAQGDSPENGWQHCHSDENSNNMLLFSSPNHFNMSRGFFLESLPKGSATWPEEKLTSSSSPPVSSALPKSRYKFLKTSCQNTVNSHTWGLVIVTAGMDGRIRSFHNYGLPIRL